MRLVSLIMFIALAACGSSDKPAPPPGSCPTSNCASDFAHSLNKDAACLDWGNAGSGAADTAWCKINGVWSYCMAGPVKFEKGPDGKLFNVNAPGCDGMIDTRPKAAAQPAPQQPAQPAQPPPPAAQPQPIAPPQPPPPAPAPPAAGSSSPPQ